MGRKPPSHNPSPLSGGGTTASLRAQIYTDVRGKLQRAEFRPGDRLVDTELATQYRTSRMPAREALMALASQGFLRPTTRGFAVPELSSQDVRDIFAVRRLLEPEAAAAAARNLDADGLAALIAARDLAREAVETDAPEALMEANIAFRGTWLSAVGNRRLIDTIESFRDHIQTVRIATLHNAGTRVIVLTGIEALSSAFVSRDEEAVRREMRAFMAAAEAEFFAAVSVEEADRDASPA
ncbi:GntR family transcriptional regulator [Amorphus orientalis]|uniref:DNA-binding GntR family transcriptional regulator n=1 Tax=Amorphus orientalis TaxID=649198 RepID=A0AAE3VL29_9HYPH|nr:GntR family transcriptional regulator [Amorphus orientalis]MDQ0314026.1 DNA-binding GntR family transcriptional regulator [Amorphus orientalis]